MSFSTMPTSALESAELSCALAAIANNSAMSEFVKKLRQKSCYLSANCRNMLWIYCHVKNTPIQAHSITAVATQPIALR